MAMSLYILVTYLLWTFLANLRRRAKRRFASATPGGIPWLTDVADDKQCQTLARLLFDHCNAFRQTHRLHAMTWNDELSVAAFNQSHRMQVTGEVEHVLSDGVTMMERIGRAGYVTSVCRENLAWYVAPNLSLEQLALRIHTGWVNSPGHCVNLLARDCDELGIGVVGCRKVGFYCTQNFGKSQGGSRKRTAQPPTQSHAPPTPNAKPFDRKALHNRSQHPWH